MRTTLFCKIVFGPCFGRNAGGNLCKQYIIKTCRHADGLWEDGGIYQPVQHHGGLHSTSCMQEYRALERLCCYKSSSETISSRVLFQQVIHTFIH